MLVAGGALLFAQQTGLLEELMSPPEDPEDIDEDEIDDTDPDDRNRRLEELRKVAVEVDRRNLINV